MSIPLNVWGYLRGLYNADGTEKDCYTNSSEESYSAVESKSGVLIHQSRNTCLDQHHLFTETFMTHLLHWTHFRTSKLTEQLGCKLVITFYWSFFVAYIYLSSLPEHLLVDLSSTWFCLRAVLQCSGTKTVSQPYLYKFSTVQLQRYCKEQMPASHNIHTSFQINRMHAFSNQTVQSDCQPASWSVSTFRIKILLTVI